jgi:cell division protein ZapA (FtsZ GTPase activity inhibitor)
MASVHKVEMLGASFTIQSDEKPEYVDSLIRQFKIRAESVRINTKTEDPLRIAILAGLFLIDELKRAAPDRRIDAESAEAERRALSLIAKLDERLNS